MKSLLVPPRHWRLAMAIGLVALAPWPIVSAHGQGVGALGVSPKRIVIEGRSRTAQVLLLNKSTSEATYRIYFTNMRMTEDGRIEELTEPKPGELFADGLIRYSPRQVTIPGRGSQNIRLLIRKPSDLPPGEYRSHLVFRSVVPADLGQNIEAEATEAKPGEVQINLIALYAISIPIIVRHGELSASVELSQLRLKLEGETGTAPTLAMRLDRAGNRSVFGDVFVTHTASDGTETEVGRILGIAVYAPNDFRTVRLRLSPPDGLDLKQGRLHVVYREKPGDGGAVLAEAELALP